jgi:hypothetical protein
MNSMKILERFSVLTCQMRCQICVSLSAQLATWKRKGAYLGAMALAFFSSCRFNVMNFSRGKDINKGGREAMGTIMITKILE